MYVIQICEKLKERGVDLQLEIFGEGIMKQALENYIIQKELKDFVFIRGNKTKEELKQLKEDNFLLRKTLSERKEEISSLEEKIKILKLAKTLDVGTEKSTDLKLKINKHEKRFDIVVYCICCWISLESNIDSK